MSLSTHDKTVLSYVFNPEHPREDDEVDDVAPNLGEYNESKLGLSLEIIEQIKSEETSAVKLAELGDHTTALHQLTELITRVPSYASTYNNRAQVHRLIGDNKAAMNDLDMALNLTQGHGLVACQAFTQRGILHRLEENTDSAVEDLRKAAALGSKFARKMLVDMNPYAALCNQMLNQIICQLKRGSVID